MVAATDSPSAVSSWRSGLSMVETTAGEIAVYERGEGQPVVMLHGIPTHSYVWRDVAKVVALGHRVIAPDLAGFGFSTRREDIDISPFGQADVIEQVLEKLGVESMVLVGHDLGALVAFELLKRNPERVARLVVCNTSLRHEDWTSASRINPLAVLKLPVAGEVALKIARPAMLKTAFAMFVNERQRLDEATMALYWHPFEHGFDRTLLRMARENRLDDDTFHGWKAALYDFGGPALVAWGRDDRAFRPDRAHEIVRLLHRCRYELFLHSNHFIQEDRPLALGRLIASFAEGRLDA